MLTKRWPSIAIIAAALALAAATTAAARSSAGRWTRISGPKNAGPQLGLARRADGTLDVIWNRGSGTMPTTIFDTRLSPAGDTLGTTTVATNWGGAMGLGLLVMPDRTLRLFATGAHAPGTPPGQSGMNTLTAKADGTGWTLAAGDIWGGAGASASTFVGAVLTKDGQPATAWAAAGVASVKLGLTSGDEGTQVCPCFAMTADLATDQGSGAVVEAGTTIGTPAGTFVQQALPTLGQREVLHSATDPSSSGIAARIGAPGVFVAFTDRQTVQLHRYQGPTTTVARGPYTLAKVFAAPGGRLWLAWGGPTALFVTRSNMAASRFEPVQHLTLPARGATLWNAQGEGSAGPLDLFADVERAPGDRGFWHTHILPRLSAFAEVIRDTTTRKGVPPKPTEVIVRVSDAGDPVAGATVTIGGTTEHTDAAGRARFTLATHGPFHGTVAAEGYERGAVSGRS